MGHKLDGLSWDVMLDKVNAAATIYKEEVVEFFNLDISWNEHEGTIDIHIQAIPKKET